MRRRELSTDAMLASLDRLFNERRSQPAASPRLDPYILAAAVLHVFDPSTLRPYGRAELDESLGTLLEQSVAAIGWRYARLRTLRPDVRSSALKYLGHRDQIRKAAEANPSRELTSVQEQLDRWLAGDAFVPESMRYAELESLRQLYDWGIDTFGGLPDRARFDEARARRSTVAVFEHLVDSSFVGREAELQLLRDHVGVVAPSVWSRVRSFLTSGPRPPLVIWGPGGSGKTALIGRFIMEHVEAPQSGWFPFAYLPFDSDTLDVREPFTLLVAAAAQLSSQVLRKEGDGQRDSSLSDAFRKFQTSVAVYRDSRGVLSDRANAVASQDIRLHDLATVDATLYGSFAELLRGIAVAAGEQQTAVGTPVVLIFDTFEEVLYRTREDLLGFWRMLEVLQAGFSNVRFIVAGRSQPRPFMVGGSSATMHLLGDLTSRDARRLLKLLGVSSDAAADAIVGQVGGNPLSLRLAARVARQEDVSGQGISDLQTRRYWLFGVAPELIRGQLYRRILDHIHDPDVRALAHPGMVLRRVTSQIIEDVLAPECGLANVDRGRAEQLFDALQQEHAFVRVDDDSSLRYREEVRRPVLELLLNDKPREVRRIHERIIEFYADRSANVIERAEEIYHRLMLGVELDRLGLRWMPGVERYLSSAVEEIPPAHLLPLASQMSLELSPDLYRQADLAQWERLIGRKAVEARRYEGAGTILGLLSQRGDRTPESPLFAIEARALIAQNRAGDAAALIERAMTSYPPVGNPGRLAELLWLGSQAALQLNDRVHAMELLHRLAELGRTLDSKLPRLQALVELVKVAEDVAAESVTGERLALAATLYELEKAEVDRERALVRLALVRLGRNFPKEIRYFAPSVLFDLLRRVERGMVDLTPRLPEMLTVLRRAETPNVRVAVERVREPYDSTSVLSLLRVLLETGYGTRADESHGVWVDVFLIVLESENATLASATLAGLDSYREPWELDVTGLETTL